MKVTYDLSVSEIKSLLEIISELCHRSGLNEVVSKSLLKRLNEKYCK